MAVNALRRFLQLESTAGLLLVFAAILALIVSNSPLSGLYAQFLEVPVQVSVGGLVIAKPLLLWINDGLMALFFFLIGLEVKREVLEGQLASRDQIILPGVAALGGFAVPALVYAAFNWQRPDALGGWAIPAATDIAFALGVLAVLGSRVPLALKVFLTTIAIFDDIAAIVVIAAFYTESLSVTALGIGGAGLLLLLGLNRAGVQRLAPYALVGLVVWVAVLKSGVHATLAGFLVGLMIPIAGAPNGRSLLRDTEHALHPWIAYAILPIFAFANAGVSFAGLGADAVFGTVSLGIAAGLFIGKQAGVMGAVWLCVSLGLARLPAGIGWRAVYGVALLTGIGFTMSLFVGSLAFEAGQFEHLAATRVGVLVGSIASAVAGYLVLRRALNSPPGHQG